MGREGQSGREGEATVAADSPPSYTWCAMSSPVGLTGTRASYPSYDSGSGAPYRWFAPGDINAFFGLMLDNVVNLAVLGGILIGAFGFPAELVYTKMFPGTALGVLVGDLIYTWLAFRLAKKTGRTDVTAMPLGLD